MSCCGNHNHESNNNSVSQQEHGSKAQRLKMTLCCVLPITLVVLVILSNAYRGEPTNYLLMGILLICPLSHMVIMPLINKMNNRQD